MSRTILLADDSLTIQKVVELTFADTDYEVVAVSSGDELLQRLPECRPDVVICDVIMPGRDGYEVCQEIKSNADYLHVPVILLTGTFEPFDRDRALAVGCSEITTKPFEARKLLETVDRLAGTLGAAPPPAPSTGAAPALDVEVTPPPPIDVPDEADFIGDEMEFEDTDVTADDGRSPTDIEATSEDDEDVVISTEEEITHRAEDGQTGVEFALDEPAAEDEPPVLPDVALPPDDEFFSETPNPADTVATPDFSEMVETTEDEVFVDPQPPGPAEDPFSADATDEEAFPHEGLKIEEPAIAGENIDNTMTTPINVEAVMAEHPPEEKETSAEIEVESTQADISDADTQDITEEVSPPEHAGEPESTGLSDEDVDRIARRLLELASDRIENIAWDVIPDMAELVVRERVREIEAAAEREHS
jgi:CheY-like chemotaxis protein